MKRLKYLAPLLVLVALAGGVWAAGLQHYATFAALGQQEDRLLAFVGTHRVAGPLVYIAAYVAMVSLSLPLGVLMSVAGGVLFGRLPGGLYAVTGASLGAVVIFLFARTASGALLSRRAGAVLDRLRPGLERDGFSTLLALRLLPIVPFWVLNIAAAVARMRLSPFFFATVLGIAPTTMILASVGAGLGGALSRGERPELSVLFSAPVLGPLVGLAALVMAPVGWRAWRRRHA